MTSRVIKIDGEHSVDLNKGETIGIASKEDLMDLLKSGEVLVYDTRRGAFVSNLMGVPLPSGKEVARKAIAAAGSPHIV